MHVRKQLKGGVFSFLLCLLAVMVVACGGGTANNNSSEKAKDQIYVSPIAGVEMIKTLDPAMVTDANSSSIIRMVYSGLVNFDKNLKLQGELAQDIQLADDNVTYTFKLKPNLTFSNGDPLTSKEIVWSLNRALDPKTKSPSAASYMSMIKGVDEFNAGKRSTLIGYSLLAPDPGTVKIILSQPAQYFLQSLAYPTSYIVNPKLVEKYGDKWTDHSSEGAGSGQFVLTKAQRSVELILDRNEKYFGPKPQLQRVVRPFYKSGDVTWKAYQSNQLMRSGVPAAQRDAAKKLPNGQFTETKQLWISYFALNYLISPFDNIKIRQAFALAINKDILSTNIDKGATIPTNHIVPEGADGYNPNLTGPGGVKDTKGDPELAKKLFEEGLKEKGLTRETMPTIKYTTSFTSSAGKQSAEAIQQMWEKTLGIKVVIDNLDWNTFLDVTNNARDNDKAPMIWESGWIADYPDPQDWLTLLFTVPAQNSWNYGHDKSKSPNLAEQKANMELMKKADAERDNAKRMQMYNQAEQQLVNDVAWIPLSQNKQASVTKPCVKNLVDNPMGIMTPDGWADVYISNDKPCPDVSKWAVK
ncbi:peptide/nickel transport system substrate-binding protein/oligopeptide transport system substrate-binding protein [Thermosporothrix hazakensis]|uniref:Peptide/nickel transport system substrate-binding protein/oligopeptide transport system substrate-binding protein n=2 Tax=Thermosporothrix TaxID=768650 RepID=A0A326TRV2_THEHA|nr:peptide ABC transporter substrate-binding protein [Thermosporothrix hazakensis]PZW18238.1 peptide/nickel transport system substrate-binding protein/oligopeptide transport system substrate-binding protein [Thermosporothrix hazakensis]BBH90561.1 oligopeptide-binding protein OppA [Thermosporothrix sp. COM3]GCE48614.1 oligopeptide-binding protein OppA [Thermosporothrix hazakensis]